MHAKLFVIWLKNKIVMISFQVHIEHSCEKSLTGRGDTFFQDMTVIFFKMLFYMSAIIPKVPTSGF